MSRQSITLLSSPPNEQIVYTSPSVKVNNWPNVPNVQATLSIATSNFQGRVIIEASIKVTPGDNDWFPVALNGLFYLDYPIDPLPSSTSVTGIGGETSTTAYNFTGRFVWMRATIDLTEVLPYNSPPLMASYCGLVDRILVNI